MKMTLNQSEVMDKTKKDIYLKQMDVVQVGDISKLQKNGILSFIMPRFGKIIAKAK